MNPPHHAAVAALFDEVFARCNVQRDAGDLEGFVLRPGDGNEVQVRYDQRDQVIWLTSFLDPITASAAPDILRRLLLNNLDSVEHGYACSMDPYGAVPIVQSWLSSAAVCMSDFEAAIERHSEAVRHIRLVINRLPAETAGAPTDVLRVWG